MSASSYDTLLPYVLTETPSVPFPSAISAINHAVRHLCLESSCWWDWQQLVLVDGESDYELTPPNTKSSVRNIKAVMLGDIALMPIPENVVAIERPWLMTETGTPTSYYAINGVLHLMPTPAQSDAGKVIKVKAAYVPSLNATGADANLIDRYAETIACGAKAKLMAMPGQPWSNPSLSQHFQIEFEKGVSRARIEYEQSESMSGLRVMKRRFG